MSQTTGGGGYRGSTNGEVQWPIGPGTTGLGTAAPMSDAPGQLVDVAGGMAAKKWQAAAGSPAP